MHTTLLMLVLNLFLLAIVSFVQNMAFTWTSRSRNSGDPDYHRYASWCSNGIWFLCQILIIKSVWEPIMRGEWWYVALSGAIYIIATSEGSVLMMRILLKKETGKQQVGAR